MVFRADGSLLNGQATIGWRSFTTANGESIAQDKLTVDVVDGVLSLELAPNEGAQPPGMSYEVVFNLEGSERFYETWVVPVSPTPVALSQIRVIGAPPSGAVISQSQVTGLVAALAARAKLAGGNSLTGTQTIRAAAAGEPVLALTEAAGERGIYFRLPVLGADTTFTLPASDGSANQQLTTDGAGNLFWAPAGPGGGGGGANALGDLSDVLLAAPAAGQGLMFNGASWTNRGLAAADIQNGTFSDARISRSSVDQHATTTPDANRIPLAGPAGRLAAGWLGTGAPSAATFLRGDGAWATPPGGASTLDALSDVTVASAALFQILKYDGAGWVNGNLDGADIQSGLINPARLGSGAPSSANFLRGDGAWASPPAAPLTSVFGRAGAVAASEGDYSLRQLSDVGAFTPSTDNVLRWTGTEWTAAAISGAMLPLPTASALGGVTAQACSSGDFVTGISPASGNPVCATPTGVGSAGAGEPNQSASFTSEMSVLISHGFGHNRLIVTCYDEAENWMDWGGMSIGPGPAYDVTVTFAAAKTGRCVVNGSATQARRHVAQFSSATRVTVTAATHGLGANPVVAGCRSGVSPKDAFEPGAYAVDSNGDVVIDFAMEKSGECVIQ